MRHEEGNIIHQNNIGAVVSKAKLHDIVPAERLLEYQRLMFQFSENILLSMAKGAPHSNQIMSREEENASQKASIDALRNLQAIVTADLQKLQREEPPVWNTFVDANHLQQKAVSKNASPLADPLPNACQVLRKGTPYFAIEDSGVPILESPVYFPSPVIESTPRNESNSAGPAQSDASSEPLLLSSEFHGDELFDTGTQCSSNDLQSVSEPSDDVSEYKNSDDSDYVDDSSPKAKRKAGVKHAHIQNNDNEEPAPSNNDRKNKRICYPPELFNPDNPKLFKNERVFKRVQIDGAPVRADDEKLKYLQEYYGTNGVRNWKSVYGKGKHKDHTVIVNPHGQVYNLRNNPILGTDFFLTVEDARTYCKANLSPRKELPMPSNSNDIHLSTNKNEEKAKINDDDGDASNVSDDVTEISQFEGYYRSCRCSSKGNCHCCDER